MILYVQSAMVKNLQLTGEANQNDPIFVSDG
jgi:hypothetical protein